MTGPLLDIRDLVTEFRTEAGLLRAVKGVDLTIARGETLALVGESGSGKSVTSLSAMRLIPDRVGRIAGGEILFQGRDGRVRDLAQLDQRAMSDLRGSEIAMIFQEPMTSLNPAHRIGAQIAEAARLHEGLSAKAARARAIEMLRLVEIPEPERRAEAYPHQLSGGMRQRVMIASALVCNPSLLIADEPTTALDSTVQLQILVLLKRLQEEFRMGILFITHNLGVVAEIADRVAVMYGGRIVEDAPVDRILEAPRHPYTKGLLGSVPRTDHAARASGQRERLVQIPGSMVDPLRPPPGCDFEPRCAWSGPACRAAVPPLEATGPEGHARCIRWKEIA
ncbi:ABC transporter ATP-binding protein [Pseudoroseicyclus aestuarii]|uniref:Peptide/nickel transport system ATP-binding protein n=1 Tax=Pseudoroseicyclus aestuarii TaxID=1795041 RepID=A0A318SNU1_9RHOB|nr:ABC transporter ATP-binding protein [Pseudoroseicyclus aestuarii]PYE82483.1 peptide/nickel transport system ATP-binding protein [Pseudoroseicyclus aestuarii]